MQEKCHIEVWQEMHWMLLQFVIVTRNCITNQYYFIATVHCDHKAKHHRMHQAIELNHLAVVHCLYTYLYPCHTGKEIKNQLTFPRKHGRQQSLAVLLPDTKILCKHFYKDQLKWEALQP